MIKQNGRTKKVVIPLLTLVMLSSQLMGCAALNSKELVEEMGESKEVEIEYNEVEREDMEMRKIGINEGTEDNMDNESNTNKEESLDVVIDSNGNAEAVQPAAIKTSLSADQKAEQEAAAKQKAAQQKAEQERLAAQQKAEAAKKAEQERLAAQQKAEAAKKAEQERLAAEKAKQQQQTQTSVTPTTFDTPSNTGKVGITVEDFEAGDTTGSLDLSGAVGVINRTEDQPTMYGG